MHAKPLAGRTLALLGFVLALGPAGAAAAEDPVRASFQRMLAHEASHVAPQPPGSVGEDPLRAAVSAVLWQTQPRSFHVAAVDAQPQQGTQHLREVRR